jgi:peptide/nickel transport system permease protein
MAERRADGGRRRKALTLFLFRSAGGLGLLLVVAAALGAIFAPYLTPYDAVTLSPASRLQGPSAEHWLGTDQLGRDTFTRILYGGRVSLAVAGASVAFALLVGGALGVLAGYYRGWLDTLIMRVTDVLLSFPAVLLAIALIAFLGPGFTNLVLAIGVVYVGPFARVARAAVMTVREELFVEAARALGGRDPRIVWLAVLPSAAGPLIVEVTLRLAYAILYRGVALLPRPRRPAAHAELGDDGLRRPPLPGARPLGDGRAGARHHGDRPRLQPARRRPPRRARPAAQGALRPRDRSPRRAVPGSRVPS